jgi:hypothetical protein
VSGEPEVAPGIRFVSAPGHTPGHRAFPSGLGRERAHDLKRHRLCAGAGRRQSGLARPVRSGRNDGGSLAPQAARPRRSPTR